MKKLAPLSLLALLSVSPAAANPHGILWVRGQAPRTLQFSIQAEPAPGSDAGGRLKYYGGPVIPNAKVYAVFWGKDVPSETQQKIGPFFENMLDSSYMDWLKEYDTKGITAVDGRAGTNQHIGRGSYGGAFTIAPLNQGTDLTDAMLQAELEAQINAGNLPKPSENTLYMTYFPKGINIEIEGQRSCQTFCAYHEGFKSKAGAPVYYGVMPVCGGWGCGFGGAFDNMTFVSSHEAIEAVTDPFPTPGDNPAYPQAWNTTKGEEIADICPNPSTVTGHGLTSKVSEEWSNAMNKCNPGPWGQNAEALASLPTGSGVRVSWRPAWAAPAAGAW